MLKRKIEQSVTSTVNFMPAQKRTHAQETCTMSQKQTTPDEEFKTDIHSIKRETSKNS